MVSIILNVPIECSILLVYNYNSELTYRANMSCLKNLVVVGNNAIFYNYLSHEYSSIAC